MYLINTADLKKEKSYILWHGFVCDHSICNVQHVVIFNRRDIMAQKLL